MLTIKHCVKNTIKRIIIMSLCLQKGYDGPILTHLCLQKKIKGVFSLVHVRFVVLESKENTLKKISIIHVIMEQCNNYIFMEQSHNFK